MLPQAIESPTKCTCTESISCLCCKGDMLTQRNILDHNKCVGNRLVQQIEADNPQVKQYIVCENVSKKFRMKTLFIVILVGGQTTEGKW